MQVDYRLIAGGWAQCVVEIAGRRAEMLASDVTASDPLDDLLCATLGMLSGDERRGLVFEEEPQQVSWELRREGADHLRVRITRVFVDRWPHEPESELLLDGRCRLRTFAGQVLASARLILAQHGWEGYRKSWAKEFPSARVAALEAALRI